MSLPLMLTNSGQVLVVGGGAVALRKIEWLLAGGCEGDLLTVESPELCPPLAQHTQRFRHLSRAYQSRSLEHFRLVFACTSDRAVNRQVAGDARKSGSLVNVADAPEECDFHVPATLRRGEVCLTFTAGGAPSLAAALRAEAEECYPQELGPYAAALHRLREELRLAYPDAPERRHEVLRLLSASATRDAIAPNAEEAEIYACLRQKAGELLPPSTGKLKSK